MEYIIRVYIYIYLCIYVYVYVYNVCLPSNSDADLIWLDFKISVERTIEKSRRKSLNYWFGFNKGFYWDLFSPSHPLLKGEQSYSNDVCEATGAGGGGVSTLLCRYAYTQWVTNQKGGVAHVQMLGWLDNSWSRWIWMKGRDWASAYRNLKPIQALQELHRRILALCQQQGKLSDVKQ